jgi:hypothetical protein
MITFLESISPEAPSEKRTLLKMTIESVGQSRLSASMYWAKMSAKATKIKLNSNPRSVYGDVSDISISFHLSPFTKPTLPRSASAPSTMVVLSLTLFGSIAKVCGILSLNAMRVPLESPSLVSESEAPNTEGVAKA